MTAVALTIAGSDSYQSTQGGARVLADISKWFTEGFDAADSTDAKALLDELVTRTEGR